MAPIDYLPLGSIKMNKRDRLLNSTAGEDEKPNQQKPTESWRDGAAAFPCGTMAQVEPKPIVLPSRVFLQCRQPRKQARLQSQARFPLGSQNAA